MRHGPCCTPTQNSESALLLQIKNPKPVSKVKDQVAPTTCIVAQVLVPTRRKSVGNEYEPVCTPRCSFDLYLRLAELM